MVTIAQERSRLASVGMTLRRRELWGSSFNYGTARAVDEPATRVFVHITVTNPGNYNSFDAHARAIEAIGRSRFPATGISYNRGFMAGTRNIYEFQPMGRRGAHTVNDFKRSACSTTGCPGRGSSLTAPSWNLNVNARSYVICQNVGHSVPDHMIEDIARAIAADYHAGLITKVAAENIHGHRCVSGKDCPAARMWARMGELQSRIKHYIRNGLGGGSTPPPTITPPPSGGTMSWDTTLTPTSTAADRFPSSYTKKAGEVVMHILGLTYQTWRAKLDKIPLNTTTKREFPDQPPEGYTDRVLQRANFGRLLLIERRQGQELDLLREIRAGQGDDARDEVLADIQADLTQARQERQAIADAQDAVLVALGNQLDLIDEALSGDRDLADVLRALRDAISAQLGDGDS